jgi:hypothetical protein
MEAFNIGELKKGMIFYAVMNIDERVKEQSVVCYFNGDDVIAVNDTESNYIKERCFELIKDDNLEDFKSQLSGTDFYPTNYLYAGGTASFLKLGFVILKDKDHVSL